MNDLKRIGSVIVLDGQPFIVLESQHARTAQRRAFVRAKLRNLLTGQTLEKTFNASDKVEEADVVKSPAIFLYAKDAMFYFMDQESYEEFSLTEEIIGELKNFLKEQQETTVMRFNDKPISIELPKVVELKVIEAASGVRGDTATSATKPVVLETGYRVNAPLFIKEEEIIRVNTETGQYIERAER